MRTFPRTTVRVVGACVLFGSWAAFADSPPASAAGGGIAGGYQGMSGEHVRE
jgi:hypothetical protein